MATLELVVPSLLGCGVYDANEIARLLAESADRIVSWSTPDARGNPGIVQLVQERTFSFSDLVSFAIASQLRRRGVSDRHLRHGITELRRITGTEVPLARRSILESTGTSGKSLLANVGDDWVDLGRGGLGAFESIEQVSFKALDYDELGVARRWKPSPLVVLDPRIQAGAPCVEGTRVPTSVIASMLSDETVDVVADDLDLTADEVQAAAAFERALDEGWGLAA